MRDNESIKLEATNLHTPSPSPKIRRIAKTHRATLETTVDVELELDGNGKTDINTGFGMLDHLLDLTFFWANMDVRLTCQGDMHIDAHHTVEDCGLTLGSSFLEALGDKKGITRTGNGKVPMDEALADVCVDISGRPWLVWNDNGLLPPIIAHEEKDLWREFYKAFASAARMNLHVNFLYGENGHHLLESVAKGFGIALCQAVSIQTKHVRSTKGGLD